MLAHSASGWPQNDITSARDGSICRSNFQSILLDILRYSSELSSTPMIPRSSLKLSRTPSFSELLAIVAQVFCCSRRCGRSPIIDLLASPLSPHSTLLYARALKCIPRRKFTFSRCDVVFIDAVRRPFPNRRFGMIANLIAAQSLL